MAEPEKRTFYFGVRKPSDGSPYPQTIAQDLEAFKDLLPAVLGIPTADTDSELLQVLAGHGIPSDQVEHIYKITIEATEA